MRGGLPSQVHHGADVDGVANHIGQMSTCYLFLGDRQWHVPDPVNPTSLAIVQAPPDQGDAVHVNDHFGLAAVCYTGDPIEVRLPGIIHVRLAAFIAGAGFSTLWAARVRREVRALSTCLAAIIGLRTRGAVRCTAGRYILSIGLTVAVAWTAGIAGTIGVGLTCGIAWTVGVIRTFRVTLTGSVVWP
ncbi:hypothetical protein BH24ACT15_BH24ACT15_06590 [soil metagenome]